MKKSQLLARGILSGLVVICLTYHVKAQIPEWKKSLSTLDGNFHEKRAAIQTFFEQNPQLIDEPGSGYKDFIRWQEFWSARVNETGSYFTANDAMLAYQNDISLYCNGSSSIDVNWELLGPISTPPRVDLNSPNYGSHGMGITRAVWVNPANPNHILLGSGSGGLWKSMDGGQNWTNITDSSGLMTLGVNSIAVHPITGFIYITTGIESSFWGLSKYYGFGLLKSADGGNSWETTGLSFSPGGPLPVAEKVVFDESDITGQRAFALVEHQILETTDFGVTWSAVLTGQVSERFTDIDFNAITPSNWVACSSDGTESFEPNVPGKFYRSSNNGNSWSEFTNSISSTPITYATLEYSEAGVDVIYAAIAFDGATDKVFKSSDNGITWSEQGNVPGGWKGTFEVSKFDENRLYFGCLNVVQSNDGGLTNTAISNWGNLTSINYLHADHRDLKSVEIGGQEYLYSAHDGGLGRKLISESAWQDLSGNGLAISQIYAVGVGSSGKVYGGMQDLSTNFYDGNAWFNIGQGDGGNCMVDYLDENVTYSCWNGIIVKSNDGGLTSTINNYGSSLSHDVPMDMHPSDPTIFWASKGTNQGADVRRWDPLLVMWVDLLNNEDMIFDFLDRPSTLRVAPSDPNRLYLVAGGATWGEPLVGRIWKTDEAMGITEAEWIDITSGLDALLWASAEDIAIDPENPDRIWITFQNFSDGQKVYHSPNGGTTWINQSLNLPNMPVNCIEYHTGTNDGLYIGTDVGLFYKDASMSEWKCLNSGQPALLVTDIEVDYCINKLIVSTFGRGVYRTSLVEEETFTSILTDRLIDIPTVSQGGMVIEPGVTLTVTSDLYMGANARIIVKPNARLIIDGGTISNKCGKMWSGIEVWGTSSMPQASSSFSLDPNQGKLVIKNSGVIEHANCAVRLGHLASTNPWQYDWSKTGGVINVRNGILRNNRKSIEYLSYHNYNNLGNMSANRGYFYDCSFEIDNDYRYPNQQHSAFVTMWDVDNIKFKGCNFNNSSSAVVWADRGLGIYSAMSTFTIDDYCTAGILEYGTPCPIENTLRSEFHGLQYAIKASGATNYSKVRVNHSIVQDCYNGIYLALVNNAVIIRNNFDRIENSGSPTYSLYLDECSGYEVEENVFEGLDHDGCRGLIVNNSGDAPNLVYRNLFKNHTYGILVIGDNRGLQHEGLQFRCNLFGDPGDATQSNEFALGLVDNASIADYQGNLSEYTSAANRFWPECVFYDPDDEDEIILSDPDQISIFDYIHNSGVNSPETVPECRSIGIGLIDNAVPFSIQQCPLDLEDGKDKIVVKSQMQESHDVYVSLKSAYDSYINNGEGPSLSDAVSDPSVSSVELRNVFLDASPKVSDDLMIRAMQRSPEVDGWHMAQILIANSPLREVVINAMNRYDYEPFYTALVEGAQNGTVNTRNLMEMDYAWYRSLQEQYCDDFIRLNLQEEETDWGSIQQLFNDPSAPLTVGEEASFYIEKGDWTSAHAILDSWPEPIDDEFLLYEIILRIKEFGLDSTGLQEQTITELETLVFSSEPRVKSCASFILEFWDEGTFSEELGTIGGVRGLAQIYDGETSSDIFQFEPSPNPAKESFFLTFKVPETSESGVIQIFDVSGKLVYQSKIVGNTGIIEINCSKWRTGTYIAELEVDGILLKTTKVSIIK